MAYHGDLIPNLSIHLKIKRFVSHKIFHGNFCVLFIYDVNWSKFFLHCRESIQFLWGSVLCEI